MFSLVRRFAVAGVLVSLLSLAWHLQQCACGQDPSKESVREEAKAGGVHGEGAPEPLPPPRELPSETIVWHEPYFFQPPTRTNRYEVWQFYDVSRFGQFRPRVIYSAYGAFYLYDGQPFPWVSTHQRDFSPRLIGP
jgi:hypothetical protein